MEVVNVELFWCYKVILIFCEYSDEVVLVLVEGLWCELGVDVEVMEVEYRVWVRCGCVLFLKMCSMLVMELFLFILCSGYGVWVRYTLVGIRFMICGVVWYYFVG